MIDGNLGVRLDGGELNDASIDFNVSYPVVREETQFNVFLLVNSNGLVGERQT